MRAEFRQDLPKGVRVLFAGIALTGVSVALVAIGLAELNAGTVVFVIVGGVGLLFFGTATMVLAWRILARRPVVAVQPDGLVVPGAGLLPWREIGRITIQEPAGQRMLGITPVNLEAYLARLSPARRVLARLNVSMGFAPIAVAENAVPVSLEELIATIERQRRSHDLTR